MYVSVIVLVWLSVWVLVWLSVWVLVWEWVSLSLKDHKCEFEYYCETVLLSECQFEGVSELVWLSLSVSESKWESESEGVSTSVSKC